MRYKPYLKCLVYGEPGAGKTSFAATFSKPMLVWQFDPHGKDSPYMKGANRKFLPASQVGDLQWWDFGNGTGIFYRDVQHDDGLVRIEYYHELHSFRQPTAAALFHMRLAMFHKEYDQWQTVSIDSLTGLELVLRKEYEYKLLVNPEETEKAKYDQRHWYGGSYHDLEELLAGRFPSMPMNVIAICHIHIKETGLVGDEVVKLLSLPGQLKKTAARNWQEYYRSFVAGERYLLQTKSGNMYYAATQIEAPNPCDASYEALWGGWE